MGANGETTTRSRLASAHDAHAIVELSRRVQDILTASGSLQEIGPLVAQEVQRAVADHRCFIVESVQDQLIGCAFVRPMTQDQFASTEMFTIASFPSPWHFMHSVMLDPDNRGHGIGRGMVLDFVEHLERQGKHGTIFLDCWAGSEKLREFYIHCGFDFAAVTPQEDYDIAVFYKTAPDVSHAKCQ